MNTDSTYDSGGHGEDQVSLFTLLRFLVENWSLILGLALIGGIAGTAFSLLAERSYTVGAAFMPQGGPAAAGGGLSAIAGQFGVSLPGGGEAAQSPQFYVQLLTSRELQGRLLGTTLPAGSSLSELLDVEESSEPLRREKTLRALSEVISASVLRDVGMVELRVTTNSPELSHAIASRLIELVNQFNLETRQTNAAAERRFVQDRLVESRATLDAAEEDLRAFLETNRQFQNSPQLVFEHDRLQRNVLHQQQLYTGLQQSLETARINQVRDTPLITVVQPPELPVYPDPRRLLLHLLLGGVLGVMAGVAVGALRQAGRDAARSNDPEFNMLRDAWHKAMGVQ